jgi:hypothetical protein
MMKVKTKHLSFKALLFSTTSTLYLVFALLYPFFMTISPFPSSCDKSATLKTQTCTLTDADCRYNWISSRTCILFCYLMAKTFHHPKQHSQLQPTVSSHRLYTMHFYHVAVLNYQPTTHPFFCLLSSQSAPWQNEPVTL